MITKYSSILSQDKRRKSVEDMGDYVEYGG